MKTSMRSLATATLVLMCLALGSTQVLAGQFAGYVRNTYNSEDMVLIPGTNWVVASSDATPGKTKPGYLYSINALTGEAQLADSNIAPSSAGDPECEPVPLNHLATSGLALRSNSDGTHQLMVVNHGDRMSIELFDIDVEDVSLGFTWTGCVMMPEKAFPNSVVPIGDEGLAVTISFETDNTHFTDQLNRREDTGYLLEWHRQTGFTTVAGSELSMPNGLQVDADGSHYYIAAWGSQQLLRLPTSDESGEPILIDIGIRPDNITWTSQGTLLIAGHLQSPEEVFECVATDAEVCSIPFKIIEVDPTTMSVIRVVVDGESMSSFAAATTGLEVGDEIWASSFRNTKIARYRKQ